MAIDKQAVQADQGDAPARNLRVFRATDSVNITTGMMPLDNVSEIDAIAMAAASEEDQVGVFAKVLFADEQAGISIAYTWFKPHFYYPSTATMRIAPTISSPGKRISAVRS